MSANGRREMVISYLLNEGDAQDAQIEALRKENDEIKKKLEAIKPSESPSPEQSSDTSPSAHGKRDKKQREGEQ